MNRQFKISNTTVKPKPKNGPDTRSNLHKKGHAVSMRDESGRPIVLQANQNTIIGKIDSGILGLQRGGYISIEQIDDITTVLKDHAFNGAAKKKATSNAKVKVGEMGKTVIDNDDETDKGSHVAKAGKTRSKRGTRASTTSTSRANQENE